MFISKINNRVNHQIFKGYQHEKNNVGGDILRFNYPIDYDKKEAYVDFFHVMKVDGAKHGYSVVNGDKPIASIKLQREGTVVNLQDITDLDSNEPLAYRIRINGEASKPDTGIRLHGDNGYTLITRNTTTPTVQGAAYILMKDSYYPGIKREGFNSEKTGEIYEDKEAQKIAESTPRTYANKFGGSLAGVEHDLKKLKEIGYRSIIQTPVAGGDNVAYHGYWNKNNMLINGLDNIDTFTSYVENSFKNGMKYVFDGTYTSEGIEGIHFQYAVRWAGKNPQFYYHSRMDGIKNEPLVFGIVPREHQNLRHRIINPPKLYEELSNGEIRIYDNPNYNPNKETYFNQYDCTQVTNAQLKRYDEPIRFYENSKQKDKLAINSHSDTVIPHVFQIDPNEYVKRLEIIRDFNKDAEKPIKINSAAGTMMIGQFSNFKIGKQSKGYTEWDSNAGLTSRRHGSSPYDEIGLQAIKDEIEKQFERDMLERGGIEAQDMDIQAVTYWTEKYKDIVNLYTAKVLKGVQSEEGINSLIQKGLLPEEAYLNQTMIDNILKGYYELEPKGILDKDEVTLKALMKLPLDSLEVGENTAGVLSTSYFSNRATREEYLGLTRFELMLEENPHLVDEYAINYLKTNYIFKSDIKDFADKIISELNKDSSEKLLTKEGEYTPYGEYVINIIGPDIAKYAFLKAIYGENLPKKMLPNGKFTYDYEKIQDRTTLKQLGIDAKLPREEAETLLEKINKGMKHLSKSDVEFLTQAYQKQLQGTNTESFKLAEAIYYVSSLGLDWRFDALKDIFDQDAIRINNADFKDVWKDSEIPYWTRIVAAIKKHNPSSSLIAEITNIGDLMADSYGINSDGLKDAGYDYENESDAISRLLNEAGVTTEAAYAHFYSNIIQAFSNSFENGKDSNDMSSIIHSFKNLITNRSLDYIRNMSTFIGNHDKPRAMHMFALNTALFYNDFSVPEYSENDRHHANRWAREYAMSIYAGVESPKDLPLELKLNIDNPEYFKTVSSRAVAMSKALKDGINNSLNGVITAEEKFYLYKALSDLTEGKYLDYGVKPKREVIEIPELKTVNGAFNKILTTAKEKYGLNISEEAKSKLAEGVKNYTDNYNNIITHMVRKEFPQENKELLAKMIQTDANKITDEEFAEYSLYTICLAALMKSALMNSKTWTKEENQAIENSLKDFVNEYKEKVIKSKSTPFPHFETEKNAMRKNGYAANQFEDTIQMLLDQALYHANNINRPENSKLFKNTDEIYKKLYQVIIEPAAQKFSRAITLLSALPGCPAIYYGDELGATGGEDKSKNNYHKNREARKVSKLEEGPLKEVTERVNKLINNAIGIRKREGTEALNNGTPYLLGIESNNEHLAKNAGAWLMQDGHNNINICIANLNDIDKGCEYNYHNALGINSDNKDNYYGEKSLHAINSINKDNPFVSIQRALTIDALNLNGLSLDEGMEFENTNGKDKEIYKISIINGAYKLIRKDSGFGNKIVLNGNTAENGVMILKHVAKSARRIAHKGRSPYFNKQYNILSNPYQNNSIEQIGQQLSIISR